MQKCCNVNVVYMLFVRYFAGEKFGNYDLVNRLVNELKKKESLVSAKIIMLKPEGLPYL